MSHLTVAAALSHHGAHGHVVMHVAQLVPHFLALGHNLYEDRFHGCHLLITPGILYGSQFLIQAIVHGLDVSHGLFALLLHRHALFHFAVMAATVDRTFSMFVPMPPAVILSHAVAVLVTVS
jgi:hypothetical protein